MSHPTYSSLRLDHHGIVAGICKQLKIADHIDKEIASPNSKKVTYGEATVAMIINMLGFTSRPLYLTEEFFKNKPSNLIRDDLSWEYLNDDCLGRALDQLYEYGVTELFSHVATHALQTLGIEVKSAHLDSTSLSVTGEYEDSSSEGDERRAIHITQGYSKDHRPDLKQACLLLISENSNGIPLWMEALDGNQSDTTSFRESLKRFSEQLETATPPLMVMDSAFYCEPNIQAHRGTPWLSRVPDKLKALKRVYAMLAELDLESPNSPQDDTSWSSLGTMRYLELSSTFGGVLQRWIVVKSASKLKRDQESLTKRIDTEAKQLKASLKRLCNQEFGCEADADQELEKLVNRSKYHCLEEIEISASVKHKGRGRPSASSSGEVVWKITNAEILHDEELIAQASRGHGLFTIATNQVESEISAEELIKTYKAQGATVERGFRFLKDPMFFADSVFLKSPRRIMALMMVMTLSLLVYSVAERQLREALKANDETIPSQTGKPTQRPTMRRVFQLFEGVEVLQIVLPTGQQRVVMNLDDVRQKILGLLPDEVKILYSVT